MSKWICVKINLRNCKRSNPVSQIESTFSSIFGSDLHEVLFTGDYLDEYYFSLTSENYVFVHCDNYDKHVLKLKRSKLVHSVLNTYDDPSFVSEDEIAQFKEGMNTERENRIDKRDVVRVKDGYMKDLIGVVIGKEDGLMKVIFQLFTISFADLFHEDNLEKQSTLSEKVFGGVYGRYRQHRKGNRGKAKS